MRELELDAFGNLFVVSAQASGAANDWITVYDTAIGNPSEQRFNVSETASSPTALLVSGEGDELYVSSSINTQTTGDTRVHQFSVQRSGGAVTNLSSNGFFDIINITSNGQDCSGVSCGHYAGCDGHHGERCKRRSIRDWLHNAVNSPQTQIRRAYRSPGRPVRCWRHRHWL